MKAEAVSSPQPVVIPEQKVWLQVCGWKVPAGFPSPAADHTRKRIDLNEHLIRNGDTTFIFKVKGDSVNRPDLPGLRHCRADDHQPAGAGPCGGAGLGGYSAPGVPVFERDARQHRGRSDLRVICRSSGVH